ncbi:helix-turn-helix transcriptional regulator [Terasakiella sp. SH-1]|uniref:helix-turn-helix transcriptional regulator n=1 Tax=Terasakiella sp. SH-1 TaxID=2560057 RepID=UPI00142FE20D|nr:helix-turn-helix transcriptional regulator [Terasakiella sp. SH-1]
MELLLSAKEKVPGSHDGLLHSLFLHLSRGVSLWLSLAEKEQINSQLEHYMQHAKKSFGVIDLQGKVLFANGPLDIILQQQDGISLRGQQVSMAGKRAADEFRKALADFSQKEDMTYEVFRVERLSPKKDYIFEMTRFPVHTLTGLAFETKIMISIKELDFVPSLEKLDFDKLFGLTDAESTILSELFVNKSEQEVAEAHSISLNTVKTHRKRIYSKLDVNTRAELVSLVKILNS